MKGVKDLPAGERLGRKLTFSPFIPHDRGLSAIRMNTVLERYGHSVRRKQYKKKTRTQKRSESRDIDENNIV